MKTKTENLLPKTLPGTVHTQFVRCGKSNCKCSRGALHGPYFYHFVRIGGCLRKRYLKASEAERVQAACIARRVEEKTQRNQAHRTWGQIREIRDTLRSAEKRIDENSK